MDRGLVTGHCRPGKEFEFCNGFTGTTGVSLARGGTWVMATLASSDESGICVKCRPHYCGMNEMTPNLCTCQWGEQRPKLWLARLLGQWQRLLSFQVSWYLFCLIKEQNTDFQDGGTGHQSPVLFRGWAGWRKKVTIRLSNRETIDNPGNLYSKIGRQWNWFEEVCGRVGKIPWRWKWQCTSLSCLGNPMDRGAWQAAVHGIAKELNTA